MATRPTKAAASRCLCSMRSSSWGSFRRGIVTQVRHKQGQRQEKEGPRKNLGPGDSSAVGFEDGTGVAGGGRVGCAWFAAVRFEDGAGLPKGGEEAPEVGEEGGGGFVALYGCSEGFGLAGRGCGERGESDDEGNEGDQGEGGDAEMLGAAGHGWTSWGRLTPAGMAGVGGPSGVSVPWGRRREVEDEDWGSFLPEQS